MTDPNTYTDFANDVIERIAANLFSLGIAHDTGDGCIYFNDTKERKTYRVLLEECPYYEGD